MVDLQHADSLADSDDPQREYRTVEPWAVGGLLLGLLASAALLGGLLWLLAGLALVANLIALARLTREPHRTGRPAALCGLALSVVFGVAPAAQIATSWILLSRQARPTADQFLEFLREDSPEKAMMLKFGPDQRQPFDDLLWTFFRHDVEGKQLLAGFVKEPVVRTILALGRRADIRFYKTAAVATEGTRGVVTFDYTVTYPDKDGKKTFFITLLLERKPTEKPDVSPWRVVSIEGGFNPNDRRRKDTKGR